MIYKYDELKEYVAEDFDEFFEWGFNEKQILLATLDVYKHGEDFCQTENICIHIFLALHYMDRKLYCNEIIAKIKVLMSNVTETELKRELGGEYFKYCMDLHMVLNCKTGGYIWKNKRNLNTEKIVSDVQLIAERSGNVEIIEETFLSGKDYICTYGGVTSTYADALQEKHLMITIYTFSNLNDLEAETWEAERSLPTGSNMSNVIFIEEVSGCEPLLLNFLYEYLKLNPEDIFFAGQYKWYFTYEDIKRIIKRQRVDNSWYYKNPILKNVDYWDNHIEINGNRRDFECKIMQVIKYREHYIVQHGSGMDTGIRNIYCLDDNADIVWQLENLFERCPNAKKQGIEKMRIEDGVIVARDLAWKNKYFVNIETGEVERQVQYKNGGYLHF